MALDVTTYGDMLPRVRPASGVPAKVPGIPAATAGVDLAADEGTLEVTSYQWIIDLHPGIEQVNADFAQTFPIDAQIAPTEGFGFDRFVAEARDQPSTWDMDIGVTPFWR